MVTHKYRSFWCKIFFGFSRVLLALLVFNTTPVLAEDDSLAGAEQFSPGSPVDGSGSADFYDPNTNNLVHLPYQIIDNTAVYGGDIVLGDVNELFPNITSPEGVQNGAVISNLGWLWDDGIFVYRLDDHDDPTKILAAMADIEAATSIRFLERTNETAYANFRRDGGCSSSIGMLNNGQTIQLQNPGCMSNGTIQHEIFHALGVYHEQSRQDRDTYVRINFSNIQTNRVGNFNKAGITSGDYNYGSIMHYGKTAFNISPGLITIQPIDQFGNDDNSITIGQRTGLSQGDIDTVQHLYFADLQLDIDTSVSEVDPDSPLQAIIDITNLRDNQIGSIIAKGVEVSMPLNQSSYLGFNGNNWSCQQVAQTVECELDILDRNATSTLTLNLRSPSNLFNINLTPTVSASNLDKVAGNNSDTATVTVKNLTDVAIDISTSSSNVQVGETLTVDLALENSSQVDAQQLEVQLTTANALSYNAFSGTGWSCSASANVTTCNLPGLSAGDTSDLSLTFDAVSGLDDAEISVIVSSQNNDGDESNNNKSTSVDVINVTDLAVQVRTSNASVKKGDSVTINADLENTSNTDTTDISVVLTADDALNYTDFSGSDWSCTNASTATTCMLSSLARSATSQLSLRFEAIKKTSAASISVTVSSQLPDSDSSNNNASASLVIKTDGTSASTDSSGGGGGGAIDILWFLFVMLITGYQLFSVKLYRQDSQHR